MATRLRKYINKCIKIYVDKTDQDQDDEDFHGSVAIQTEKKWRPRRAATSRALDTIKGAFDDDKFEVDYERNFIFIYFKKGDVGYTSRRQPHKLI